MTSAASVIGGAIKFFSDPRIELQFQKRVRRWNNTVGSRVRNVEPVEGRSGVYRGLHPTKGWRYYGACRLGV